jgi:hypothetical protein
LSRDANKENKRNHVPSKTCKQAKQQEKNGTHRDQEVGKPNKKKRVSPVLFFFFGLLEEHTLHKCLRDMEHPELAASNAVQRRQHLLCREVGKDGNAHTSQRTEIQHTGEGEKKRGDNTQRSTHKKKIKKGKSSLS